MNSVSPDMRRGIANSAAKNSQSARYRIDGIMMSTKDVAKALGIPETTASSRMSKLRRASGAITLQRLRDFGK